MRIIRGGAPVVILTIFSVLIIYLLQGINSFKGGEDFAYDLRVRYFSPPTSVSDKIVMVWIDEETIRGLPYRSPVPRDFLKLLNERIAAAGPLIVAYDIFFEDPTVERIDKELSVSFSKSPTYSVSAGHEGRDGITVEDLPLDIFKNTLEGYALADLPFSAHDSIVREFQPFKITSRGKRPTFAAELFEASTGVMASAVLGNAVKNLFGLKFKPYGDIGGEMRGYIRYAGPPGVVGGEGNIFPIFPANLVAAGFVPSTWLQGKIVLVGSAYEYSQDAFLTPYYSKHYNYRQMNGVEIHANILSSLLMREFYYLPSGFFVLLTIVIVALVITLAGANWPLWRSLLIFLIVVGLYLFSSFWFFRYEAVVLPMVAPTALGVLSLSSSLAWRSATEGKKRRFIKGVFARYVPPAVVDQMISHPDRLVLGGEEREVTSLFTDIASFTSISERLEPHVLVNFLNEYLDRVASAIFKYGGTLDKYEGDAVIAFFGAPVDVGRHKDAAVRAAIEIQKISSDVSARWKGLCGREISTRVGINSGRAVVGNMGSEGRFDYTAIGDTVNLASRLEGANKFYGTRVLFSEATKNGLSADVLYRPVDCIRVKGKEEAVNIYEAIGFKGEMDDESVNNLVRLYGMAYSKYQERDFDGAIDVLGRIGKRFGADALIRGLIERCKKGREGMLGDLVTRLDEK